jgi:hypothetical protein
VAPASIAAFAAGDVESLARDAVVGPILAYIESSTELGNFRSYTGVCEVSVGVEVFTPGRDARPTLGSAGERTFTPIAAITTWADQSVSAERLEAILATLASLHPWEIPVIEVGGGVPFLPRKSPTL